MVKSEVEATSQGSEVPGKGTRKNKKFTQGKCLVKAQRGQAHTRQVPGRGTRVSEASASKPRWTWLKCAVAGEGKVQLHLCKPNVATSQFCNCSQHAHFS